MGGRPGVAALSQAAAASMPFVPLCLLMDGGWPGASPLPGKRRPVAAGAVGGDLRPYWLRLFGRTGLRYWRQVFVAAPGPGR